MPPAERLDPDDLLSLDRGASGLMIPAPNYDDGDALEQSIIQEGQTPGEGAQSCDQAVLVFARASYRLAQRLQVLLNAEVPSRRREGAAELFRALERLDLLGWVAPQTRELLVRRLVRGEDGRRWLAASVSLLDFEWAALRAAADGILQACTSAVRGTAPWLLVQCPQELLPGDGLLTALDFVESWEIETQEHQRVYLSDYVVTYP